MKTEKTIAWSISAIFLALILLISVLNLGIAAEPVKKLMSGEYTFAEFTGNIQSAYLADLNVKTSFINLNGLYARLAGKRINNEVVLYQNGMLGNYIAPKIEIEGYIQNLTELSSWLAEQDIPFLYVQLPTKPDLENEMVPTGVKNFAHYNGNHMVSGLQEQGVNVLDVRPYIVADAEMVEQYFYRTDHHWNAQGAFRAYQEIAKTLQEMFPEEDIRNQRANADQWEIHTKEKWLLGSLGKRVGIYYGGVDDLIWMTPKFSVEMSYYVPYNDRFYKGDFEEALIRNKYIENKYYYSDSAYCVYLGGDYGLVQHRNLTATADLKLLILKDSYMLPLQSFLSTVFQEIDVIDLRHYTQSTLAQYVQETSPDIVLTMYNPSILNHKEMFTFGVETADSEKEPEEKRTPILMAETMELSAGTSKYNYKEMVQDLPLNSRFSLSFSDAEFTQGESEGLTLCIYDSIAKKMLQVVTFDVEYCQATDGFQWNFHTPETAEGELSLLVYTGLRGDTQEKALRLENVLLEKIG